MMCIGVGLPEDCASEGSTWTTASAKLAPGRPAGERLAPCLGEDGLDQLGAWADSSPQADPL